MVVRLQEDQSSQVGGRVAERDQKDVATIMFLVYDNCR